MQPAIKIEELHKTFRLFHETTTLKATLLSFGRRKVEELEVSANVETNVFWLEVTVANAVFDEG